MIDSDTQAISGDVAIQARGVTKNFETAGGLVTAIRDVDLVVESGEFLVIVGPSGCGKTTLLRIFADLEYQTSGDVSVGSIRGRPLTNAMVFQGRSVFPWLKVRDNVAYGISLDGMTAADRKHLTSELLAMVGLSRFADVYPHQLSEGMRQRAAIARALAVDPDMLLMDEPFGALDEQTRFILQEELLRIWDKTRKTVVLVTHSIDEALTLADRVVVMTAHPGTIKESIPVPFPRPRDQSTVRSDPAFSQLFAHIWDSLKDEVRASRALAEEIVS